MVSVGRNQPCPCGSGKKYKKCHGGVAYAQTIGRGEGFAQNQVEVHRLQRERQQGKGRPIVSVEATGTRVVAVGKRLCRGPWKTFHDFLFDYIRWAVGPDWGQAELAKAPDERHPILNWYEGLCRLQAQHANRHGGIYNAPMTGAARAYLGLAYDLYTLEHNEAQTENPALQKRLLSRLRHQDQFVGARYEIRVAAILLRAGFLLDWEDETDGTRTHGEYIATHPRTGKKFWVECKIRQPDPSKGAGKGLGKFLALVGAALRKETALERIIFVDLNTPAVALRGEDKSSWRDWAVGRLRMLEGSAEGRDLPPAFVLITNFPDHHHLDTAVPDAGAVIEGFKMNDYRLGQKMTLREAIEHRERNPEIECLLSSMAEHSEIPGMFDGEIPQLVNAPHRLIIGRVYELDDGQVGELTDASVDDATQAVACIFKMSDGSSHIYKGALSDDEFSAWKRYPETFFGDVRQPQRGVRNLLDLYDFFLNSCRDTPKERLLQAMAGARDVALLMDLSQEQLARIYAEGLANGASGGLGDFPVPQWVDRLRPPPTA